ncbi:MAG: glycerophosphodiester phosphodiesterase [Candidatus Binatia bacterium]
MDVLSSYPFFSGTKPRILGHRGAAGVAPENTLVSIQRAFDDGAQFVEIDLQGAKDGEVIIIHDDTLERTTDGHGQVKEHSLKELKSLNAGYRFTPDNGASYPYRDQKIEIPTLEEFFSTFPKAKAIVEIKQSAPPIVKKVVQSVRRFAREGQILLATEKDEIMNEIRSELSKNSLPIATGFSYGEVAAFIRWVAAGKPAGAPPTGGQALQIPCEYNGMTLVSAETVQAAHDLGIEMFVWTVNDTDEMKRLLRLSVDGIITDYPGRLASLVRQKKAFQGS